MGSGNLLTKVWLNIIYVLKIIDGLSTEAFQFYS